MMAPWISPQRPHWCCTDPHCPVTEAIKTNVALAEQNQRLQAQITYLTDQVNALREQLIALRDALATHANAWLHRPNG